MSNLSKLITADELRQLMPGLSLAKAQLFAPYLEAAMQEQGIVDKGQRAAFLANLAHESQQLTKWLENMNYSAQRLLEVFRKYFTPATAAQYAHKPEAIANRVYANRYGNRDEASGDGWRYRAHGPIGLTFRANFRRYGDLLNLPLERNPELAALPEYGFRIAALFWKIGGCNELAGNLSGAAKATRADKKLLTQICERINGGRNGLADRIRYYELACQVLRLDVTLPAASSSTASTPEQSTATDTVTNSEASSLPAENADESQDLVSTALKSDKAKAAGLKLWPRVLKHGVFAVSWLEAMVHAHKTAALFVALTLLGGLVWLAYHNRKWLKAKLLEVLK